MMKYYQKWAEFGKFLGKTSKNVKNEVKIQKVLLFGFLEFLEFLEKIIKNFSINFREGRSLIHGRRALYQADVRP
jgi:hypothetical protein